MVLLNLWKRKKREDRDSTNISTLSSTSYRYHEQVEGSERNLVVLFEELVDAEHEEHIVVYLRDFPSLLLSKLLARVTYLAYCIKNRTIKATEIAKTWNSTIPFFNHHSASTS